MAGDVTNPETMALQALAWILSESGRAARLLDLTGLDPATLRARAGDPTLLAAAIGFLESYEPDLIACADALDLSPAVLVEARRQLERA
ncbi:hypothetical protein S2M10_26460 [Sphingomonas sp. S2M10]|uniref:DUF3572 domain-containing protein n=1 Tax=Sphingomonas sp. S2M10 TaxID=2705010 RepID=UPI00145687D3|nr:DUF3572 domain-containing protein [Sphingomonas sp. S2M10]NLS27647.1 hypothetical protein [Sphingomonas sp. S2M10]